MIVLQLLAQFLDAGTARQALAFQQLFGHRQRLLGDRQLGLGLQAGLVQLFALLLGVGKLSCQRAGLLIQLLLAVPQAREVFEGTLLLAIVLQQAGSSWICSATAWGSAPASWYNRSGLRVAG